MVENLKNIERAQIKIKIISSTLFRELLLFDTFVSNFLNINFFYKIGIILDVVFHNKVITCKKSISEVKRNLDLTE